MGLVKIKLKLNEILSLLKLNFNEFKHFFEEEYFLANFKSSFSFQNFPSETYLLSNNNIIVIFEDYKNFVNKNKSNLSVWEVSTFREFICKYFGLNHDIYISQCSCYPQSLGEYNLYKLNVTMNNFKKDCINRLIKYPNEIYLHTTILHNNLNIQHINIVNQLSVGNNLVLNLKITQH